MVASGLKTTINTDDPGISRITLTDEFKLVIEDLQLTPRQVMKQILTAVEGSFQSEEQRAALQAELDPQLSAIFLG